MKDEKLTKSMVEIRHANLDMPIANLKMELFPVPTGANLIDQFVISLNLPGFFTSHVTFISFYAY